ncbi:glycosyltransferase [Rasiella sp. SM2506]|uniref:glycosyltransferase n=1 Tax=Rasiella sp. SM2506 TaxID=3423914 RepID=UPI003D7B7564
MSKIKILYTIPNFDTAGSGKVVYDLVKGLDKNKFEVEIACSSNKGAFFKEVEKLGIVIHIRATTTPYRPYNSLFSRLKPTILFFKTNNYDIIHSWHWSSDWTEVLAARFAGAKWVYTKKAMSWGNRHWKIRSYLANFIITINEEMRDYFSYKKKQKLIPLGIDTNYYSPELFTKERVKKNTFHIITVANLVPVKGVETLIRAVKKLDDKTINLTVLGDNKNDYGCFLQTLTKELHLENQVTFLGKRQDVRPFIAASDLYVIPTLNEGRKEGMPMALVEAMSMGVPVFGSDISGINYVLKDFKNLLFEAGATAVLAKKILEMQMLTSHKRDELGNELRRYVVENFNDTLFIKAHQKLYSELVN